MNPKRVHSLQHLVKLQLWAPNVAKRDTIHFMIILHMNIQVFCHVTLGHQAIQKDWLSLMMKHYNPSEHQEPLTQCHSIRPWKT